MHKHYTITVSFGEYIEQDLIIQFVHRMKTCELEVNTLESRKVLFEYVSVEETSIEDVFEMVKSVEGAGSQWKLMVVVKGRLLPMHWSEKDRSLHELGLDGNQRYRVEVCLAWSELKKVLT